MRSNYFNKIFLVVMTFVIAGCQSTHVPDSVEISPNIQESEESKPITVQESSPVPCEPEWVLNPPSSDDGIYGSGLAKLKQPALSKKASDLRAIEEVAGVIRMQIDSLLKDFMKQSGVENQSESLQMVEAVSKKVVSDEVRGCKIVKRHICPDGTYHSLAFWSFAQLPALKQATSDETKHYIKNETALYNEFKAKQGFDELAKEIDKLDLKKQQTTNTPDGL